MIPPDGPTTGILDAGDLPLHRRAERYRITVIDGALAGRAIEGASAPTRVGSREGNSLCLEGSSVSRYHFEISASPHGFLLRDLGSTNGTFVDGYRVGEIYLPRSADIVAGEVRLRFEALSEEALIELSSDDHFGDALGRSEVMRELFSTLAKVATRDLTILLEGESGTGKERLAEAIHLRSARASGPYVVFDAAAAPPSLVESELFGHERGAFTGAVGRRIGRFEEASGGTLFLDEIGELPLELQPKLLRVLERREVRRVGGSLTIPVDVRVVAATNRDLVREMNRGAFREDLFYRLAVVRLNVPPLRQRRDDIPLLVEHFVRDALDGDDVLARKTLRSISTTTWRALAEDPWPGNVRELRNYIERTLAVSGGVDAKAPSLATAKASSAGPQPAAVDLERPFFAARDELLARFEASYLSAMLARHDGNIARAARAAGVDRMHFKRLLARHGSG